MTREETLAIARKVLQIEADGLAALSDSLGDPLVEAVDTIERLGGRVVVTGIGKSGHVANKIAATLASTGTRAYFVHPAEASHGDLGMIGRDDAVLALSKSGEAKELSDIIGYTRRFSIPLIAITANAGSTLGAAADIILRLPDAPEACGATRAPTTSTTLQMAYGDCLAVALLERRGFTSEDFKVFHPGGKLGALLLKVSDLAHTGDALPRVSIGTPMAEALAVMSAKGFGCLAVLNLDGTLHGMVTDGDIRRALAMGKKPGQIEEIATREPLTLSPETLASVALKTLNERKITQMLVMDGDRPTGIVHMHDFLKSGLA